MPFAQLVGGMGNGVACGAVALRFHAGAMVGTGGFGFGLPNQCQPCLRAEPDLARGIAPARNKGGRIGGDLGLSGVERGNLFFGGGGLIAGRSALPKWTWEILS